MVRRIGIAQVRAVVTFFLCSTDVARRRGVGPDRNVVPLRAHGSRPWSTRAAHRSDRCMCCLSVVDARAQQVKWAVCRAAAVSPVPKACAQLFHPCKEKWDLTVIDVE